MAPTGIASWLAVKEKAKVYVDGGKTKVEGEKTTPGAEGVRVSPCSVGTERVAVT